MSYLVDTEVLLMPLQNYKSLKFFSYREVGVIASFAFHGAAGSVKRGNPGKNQIRRICLQINLMKPSAYFLSGLPQFLFSAYAIKQKSRNDVLVC